MGKPTLNAFSDEQLALMSQGGNEAAMELLLERYKRPALSVSGLYHASGCDSADLLQEAMIGLVKAARTYRSGSSFRTYAGTCMKNQLLSAIRASLCKKHGPLNDADSLDRPVPGSPGRTLADTIEAGACSDPESSLISEEMLLGLIDPEKTVLSSFEISVLKLLLLGFSCRQIAERLGKTPKQVDNAQQRIKRKLRPVFERQM